MKNKVLIIHSTSRDLVSGEKIAVENQSLELTRKGNDVKVVTPSDISTTLNKFLIFKNFIYFYSLLKEFQPDIISVHGFLPKPGISLFFLAKFFRIELVHTIHNSRFICMEGSFYREGEACCLCDKNIGFSGVKYRCAKKSFIYSIMMFLFNLLFVKSGLFSILVDKFVFVSDALKEKHLDNNLFQKKSIRHYNSFRISYAPLDYSLRSGIVYAGRLSIAKGVKYLEKLIESEGEELIIIGCGAELNHLKKMSQTGKRKVIFKGSVSHSDTLRFIRCAKCVVVPSVCFETFGLVAAEAMSLGVPVVATKIGGLEEIIQKSQGGKIVDVDDYKEFVRVVDFVSGDKCVNTDLGQNGYRFAVKNFTEDSVDYLYKKEKNANCF